MRWLLVSLCWSLALGSAAAAGAEGRVLKVLPQFLDARGRSALSPSLYDRDAYQAILRRNPSQRSGFQFAIQWKATARASEPLVLRVEIRGVAAADATKTATKEITVRHQYWFSHWGYIKLNQEECQKLGEITAWRVTLVDGEKVLAEQKSFLW